MRLSFLLLLFVCCVSCKTSTYVAADGTYTLYNSQHKKKPVAIVIPEIQSKTFTDDVLKKLSKKYKVVFIPFQHENDLTRQQQIDGYTNRINYFVEKILYVKEKHQLNPDLFIAEGFNSLFIFSMATSFQNIDVFIINGLHQTLNSTIISNCFSADTSACAALRAHFQLTPEKLADLLQFSYNPNYDPSIGQYSSNFWLEVMHSNNAKQREYYKGKEHWIYFDESGLLRKQDVTPLNKKNEHSIFILIPEKQFIENPQHFIRN